MAPFLKLRNFEFQQLLLAVDGNVLAWVLPLLIVMKDQLLDSNPRRRVGLLAIELY